MTNQEGMNLGNINASLVLVVLFIIVIITPLLTIYKIPND